MTGVISSRHRVKPNMAANGALKVRLHTAINSGRFRILVHVTYEGNKMHS